MASDSRNLLRLFLVIALIATPALAGAQAPDLAAPGPASVDAQEAIKKGILAANGGDYQLAIRYFLDARKISPTAAEIDYDLGLAESKIPGRELRAMAWFGAYLAANPNAPKAAAIRSQIDALDVKSQSNNERLIQSVQDIFNVLPSGRSSGIAAETKDSYFEEIAGLLAASGDSAAAQRIAGMTADSNLKDNIEGAIAVGQAEAGRFSEAKKTAELIAWDVAKGHAEQGIAENQIKAGDLAGAEESAELINDAGSREMMLGKIGKAQAEVGDLAGAQKTFEFLSHTNSNYATIYLELDIAKAQAKVKNVELAGEALKRAESRAALIPNEKDRLDMGDSIARAATQIAEDQLKSGDIAGAQETAKLIPPPTAVLYGRNYFDEVEGQIVENLAKIGNIGGAQSAARTMAEGRKKGYAQQAIAQAQAQGGDFLGAGKTAALITDPLPKINAETVIAMAQAEAGDFLGAKKTATLANETVAMIVDPGFKSAYEKGSAALSVKLEKLEEANRTGKGAIKHVEPTAGAARKVVAEAPADQAHAVVTDVSRPESPSSLQVTNWISEVNALDTPLFLDLAGYLKTLPSGDPHSLFKSFHALVDTAQQVVRAQNLVDRMLKQQFKDQTKD